MKKLIAVLVAAAFAGSALEALAQGTPATPAQPATQAAPAQKATPAQPAKGKSDTKKKGKAKGKKAESKS